MTSNSAPNSAWRYWSPKERAVLISLVESGMGFDKVAEQLPGRTAQSCWGQYYTRPHKILTDKGHAGGGSSEEAEAGAREAPELPPLDGECHEKPRAESASGTLNSLLQDPKPDIEDDASQPARHAGIPTPTPTLTSPPAPSARSPGPVLYRPVSHWSAAQNSLLISLREMGLPYGEISARLSGHGVGACRVQHCVLMKKMKKKEKNGNGDGAGPVAAGRRSMWSEEEHAVVADGVAEGLSWLEIADILAGRSPQACVRYWERLLKSRAAAAAAA